MYREMVNGGNGRCVSEGYVGGGGGGGGGWWGVGGRVGGGGGGKGRL